MDLYRRMAAIRTQEDADELLDEIVDRFGDPPKGVMNLIAIALLRARAAAAGITEITQKDGAILLSLATMDFAAISGCCAEAQFKGRIFFSAGKVPMLSVKLKKTDDPLKLATQLVGRLRCPARADSGDVKTSLLGAVAPYVPNSSFIIRGIVSMQRSVLTNTPEEAVVSSAPYW